MYVALIKEKGEELARVDRIDRVWDIMPYPLDPSFVVLCQIDEYGNTIFNRLQVPRLMQEWARLYERTDDAVKLAILAEVQALGEKCLAVPHQYLKFVGD